MQKAAQREKQNKQKNSEDSFPRSTSNKHKTHRS